MYGLARQKLVLSQMNWLIETSTTRCCTVQKLTSQTNKCITPKLTGKINTVDHPIMDGPDWTWIRLDIAPFQMDWLDFSMSVVHY